MSFQAYLDNVEAKTGMRPEDFRRAAIERGLATPAGLAPGVKTGAVLDWLGTEHGLGRGHGMAIVALLKNEKRA
jgi:hypothetical protein